MRKTNLLFLIITIAALLVSGGVASANFVRTHGRASVLNVFGYGYGYSFGYGYRYGYGYGYGHGGTAEATFGPIYGFFGTDGAPSVTNVTATATSFTLRFNTDYTTTNAVITYSNEVVGGSVSEGADHSGGRDLAVTGLTCGTTYTYQFYVIDKGDNRWDATLYTAATTATSLPTRSTTGSVTTVDCSATPGTTISTPVNSSVAVSILNGGRPWLTTTPIQFSGNAVEYAAMITAQKNAYLGNTYSTGVVPEGLIRPGTYDKRVPILQAMLGQLGFASSEQKVMATGWSSLFYGPKTRQAVTNFQRAYGLKPDGYYGPITAAVARSLIKDVVMSPISR